MVWCVAVCIFARLITLANGGRAIERENALCWENLWDSLLYIKSHCFGWNTLWVHELRCVCVCVYAKNTNTCKYILCNICHLGARHKVSMTVKISTDKFDLIEMSNCIRQNGISMSFMQEISMSAIMFVCMCVWRLKNRSNGTSQMQPNEV